MNNGISTFAEEASCSTSQKRHTLLKLDLDSVFVPHQHHASMDTSRFEEEFCREEGSKSVNSPSQTGLAETSPKQSSSQAIPVQKSKKSNHSSKSSKSVSGSPLLKIFNSQCDAESEEEKEESLVRKPKNTAHNLLLQNTYFSPQKSTDSELYHCTTAPSMSPRNNVTSPSPRNVITSPYYSPTSTSETSISPTVKEASFIKSPTPQVSSTTILPEPSRSRSQSIGSVASDSKAIKHKVKSVLMDNEKRVAFKQLCEKEFSNENYKMFFHVQQSMKLLEQQILLVDKMDSLIQNELNLESEQRNKLVQCIQKAETEFSTFEATLQQLEELMLTNMSDTYLRFVGQGLAQSSQGLSPRSAESKIVNSDFVKRKNSLLQQSPRNSTAPQQSPRNVHETVNNNIVNSSGQQQSPRNIQLSPRNGVESSVHSEGNSSSKHSRSKPISPIVEMELKNATATMETKEESNNHLQHQHSLSVIII